MQMNVMRHNLALYLWNKLRKPTKWKLLNPDRQKKTSCLDLGWAWPLHMGWVLQPCQGCGLWVLVQNKILGDGTCVIQSQGMNGIKSPAVRWKFPRFPVLSHEFAPCSSYLLPMRDSLLSTGFHGELVTLILFMSFKVSSNNMYLMCDPFQRHHEI